MSIEITPRTVVPKEERIQHYRSVKEEGIGQKKYQLRIDEADRLGKLDVFGNLVSIDMAVGMILDKHDVYARRRVAYLSFARELYAFLRRYKKLPPEVVTALIVKYRVLEECRDEILREIVELFTPRAAAAAPTAAAITL